MSEVEQQEGQKTVVAFIAGLLIGGLLVWVFSAPEGANAPTTTEEGDEAAEVTEAGDTTTTASETKTTTQTEPTTSTPAPTGEGELEVANQPAGSVVALSRAQFPTADGWVAIRDYDNETTGGILGAARYSQSQGLIPEEVELLRETDSGKTYVAVFFTEDGSVNESGKLYFDPKNDQQIEGIMGVFNAE